MDISSFTIKIGSCLFLLVVLSHQIGIGQGWSRFYSDSSNDQLCAVPIENTTAMPTTMTPTAAMVELFQQQPCIRDYSLCDRNGTVNISSDAYSYMGAITPVQITLHSKDTAPFLYYKLCSGIGDTEHFRLISCLKENQSLFDTSIDWNVTGTNELSVEVYSDSTYTSRLDCAHTKVLVANNTGVDLHVKLVNHPDLPLTPIKPNTIITYSSSQSDHHKYLIGNMTFVSEFNLTDSRNFSFAKFTYDFGDGSDLVQFSSDSSVTHYYNSSGTYNYSVHAFVVLEDGESALHASREDTINVYENVSDPKIVVGGDNSVLIGTSEVKVSANGSYPITFCWCLVYPNSSVCSPVPNVTVENNDNITCNVLHNSSSYSVSMNFTSLGKHRFLANFTNFAGYYNGSSFNFSVNPQPSPIVVITVSSATIGILASLLAITVIIIIVIVTVIIPYRRYKYRMTETANFKFVDLSESNATFKGKMRKRANNIASYFRRQKPDRVGLVNTDQNINDFGASDRLINRNNENVVRFAPYESL